LFIIDSGSVDGIDDDDELDPVAVLAAFWILNPKIKDDVPIKKETIARIFPVRPGIIAIGTPWLVCCCCGCCCAFTVLLFMHINDRDNSIIVHVNNKSNKIITRLGNNLVMILIKGSSRHWLVKLFHLRSVEFVAEYKVRLD
jgi:hypothetical protein